MSFFSESRETVHIDDKNRVIVRPLTYQEEQDISSRCMVVRADKNTPQGDVRLDVNKIEVLTLQTCVVAWEGPGFTDDEGNPVPCTPESVVALPSWVLDPVIEAVNRINKGPGEEEKKE